MTNDIKSINEYVHTNNWIVGMKCEIIITNKQKYSMKCKIQLLIIRTLHNQSTTEQYCRYMIKICSFEFF